MSLDLVTYGGAIPNSVPGAHFTDEAFAKCLHDLGAAGGRITFPNVTLYHQAPIDLTTGPQTVWLEGEGANVSVLAPLFTSPNDALLVAKAGGKFLQLANFSIINGDGTRPPGNPWDIDPREPKRNGIAARGGSGGGFNALSIEKVEVRGFAGHAILVEGATGPVNIKQCQLQACVGMGLRLGLSKDGDTPPQNVVLEGGNIQNCGGGWDADGCSGLTIRDVDIELAGSAPDFRLMPAGALGTGDTANSVCYSVVLSNITASIADRVPLSDHLRAVIRVRNTQGLVVDGGLNYALNGADNFSFEDGRAQCLAIEIRPGYYANGAHLNHPFGYLGKNYSKNPVLYHVACNGGTYSGPPYQGIIQVAPPPR